MHYVLRSSVRRLVEGEDAQKALRDTLSSSVDRRGPERSFPEEPDCGMMIAISAEVHWCWKVTVSSKTPVKCTGRGGSYVFWRGCDCAEARKGMEKSLD